MTGRKLSLWEKFLIFVAGFLLFQIISFLLLRFAHADTVYDTRHPHAGAPATRAPSAMVEYRFGKGRRVLFTPDPLRFDHEECPDDVYQGTLKSNLDSWVALRFDAEAMDLYRKDGSTLSVDTYVSRGSGFFHKQLAVGGNLVRVTVLITVDTKANKATVGMIRRDMRCIMRWRGRVLKQ